MEKIICDICGKDVVINDLYKLPWIETVYATDKNGAKLQQFRHIAPKDVNLCEDCKSKIAFTITKLDFLFGDK